MKKMAELQLSIVTDAKSRPAFSDQIHKWEETLEELVMDQFRYKCYLASLQVCAEYILSGSCLFLMNKPLTVKDTVRQAKNKKSNYKDEV